MALLPTVTFAASPRAFQSMNVSSALAQPVALSLHALYLVMWPLVSCANACFTPPSVAEDSRLVPEA